MVTSNMIMIVSYNFNVGEHVCYINEVEWWFRAHHNSPSCSNGWHHRDESVDGGLINSHSHGLSLVEKHGTGHFISEQDLHSNNPPKGVPKSGQNYNNSSFPCNITSCSIGNVLFLFFPYIYIYIYNQYLYLNLT